jgi:hypothetical protein
MILQLVVILLCDALLQRDTGKKNARLLGHLKPLSTTIEKLDELYSHLEAAHKHAFPVTLDALSFLISGYALLKDQSRASRTFAEISNTFQLKPNTACWNGLLMVRTSSLHCGL